MIIDDPSRWEVIDEDPPGLRGSLVEDPSADDMVSLEVSLYRTSWCYRPLDIKCVLSSVRYRYCLPLVQQYLFQFEQLVKEHLPKLGEHFTREMINPSMYASQWFITVFSYSFPFHLALRIWDVFLYEGVKVVFRVGLAILKYRHDHLVKLPFEKLIHALRNFPEDALEPDTLLPLAYSFKISKRLEELKQEYEKNHGKTVRSREVPEKLTSVHL
ncbi:hypothetical protein L6164_028618 [Bauhinia variegata]|uniref:Uncharacterized protein n=1 Tax=Bauhinia variegata TaxID=167791 RepID=A0ACB9L6U9_BAUVA|nr:hypothetical protein L6164_028618 [Bauhinia variegata]